MANTFPELMGYILAILMLFIPPLIIMLYLEYRNPQMEFRRSVSFFLGWIPGNLIAIGYLWYTHLGIIDAFCLLFMIEIIQATFVLIMNRVFVMMCGEEAFDPK